MEAWQNCLGRTSQFGRKRVERSRFIDKFYRGTLAGMARAIKRKRYRVDQQTEHGRIAGDRAKQLAVVEVIVARFDDDDVQCSIPDRWKGARSSELTNPPLLKVATKGFIYGSRRARTIKPLAVREAEQPGSEYEPRLIAVIALRARVRNERDSP